MADPGLSPEVSAAIERVGQLVERFEQHPEEMVRERVFELLRSVDAVHRAGVRAVAAVVRDVGALPAALSVPEIQLLFDLYDVAEGAEKARAEAVLASLREDIESYGGALQVLFADAGVVKARLLGSFTAEALPAFKRAVEQTLQEGMPGFVSVDVEAPSPPKPRTFVPLATLSLAKSTLAWQEVLPAGDVAEGALTAIEIEGVRLILTSVEGEVFAYRDACPGTPFPLRDGTIEGRELRCPFHGCLFDLRGGRRLDRSGPGLGVVPVRVESGQIRIAIPKGLAA